MHVECRYSCHVPNFLFMNRFERAKHLYGSCWRKSNLSIWLLFIDLKGKKEKNCIRNVNNAWNVLWNRFVPMNTLCAPMRLYCIVSIMYFKVFLECLCGLFGWAWKKKKHEYIVATWYIGDTYMSTIGCGANHFEIMLWWIEYWKYDMGTAYLQKYSKFLMHFADFSTLFYLYACLYHF